MSAIEPMPYSEVVKPLQNMDDIIDASVFQKFEDGDTYYRPDYSDIERMRRIQTHLAQNGIPTSLASVYRRGDDKPITHRITRVKPANPLLRVIQGGKLA